MLSRVLTALEEFCQIDREKPLIVGVSGGPDSFFLLDSLLQLGFHVIAAHFNHGLRPAAKSEQEQVCQIAKKYRVPFTGGQADVAAYARQRHQSIEEAARNLRYQFLFHQAELFNAQAVAVGHTANDQVESVIMHLLRGSGLSGLQGMDFRSVPNLWSEEIALVRPLLDIWREDIQTALDQRKLNPILDESNQDLQYYRNRLRLEVLPFLENVNPGMQKRFHQTIDILRADNEVLEALVNEIWNRIVIKSGQKSIALDRMLFLDQPLAVRRRLIRKTVGMLHQSLMDIDFATIERALSFFDLPNSQGILDLAVGLRLEQEGNRIWVADWEDALPSDEWPQLMNQIPILLKFPCKIALSSGWYLSGEILHSDEDLLKRVQNNPNRWQAWLDLGKANKTIELRNKRPGDRFRPLGLGGHSQKVSDYWINKQLPRQARSLWPLIVVDGEIAWIPGFTISESFAISKCTDLLLLLEIINERQAVSPSPALI